MNRAQCGPAGQCRRVLLCMLWVLCAPAAHAAEPLPLDAFARQPLVEQVALSPDAQASRR